MSQPSPVSTEEPSAPESPSTPDEARDARRAALEARLMAFEHDASQAREAVEAAREVLAEAKAKRDEVSLAARLAEMGNRGDEAGVVAALERWSRDQEALGVLVDQESKELLGELIWMALADGSKGAGVRDPRTGEIVSGCAIIPVSSLDDAWETAHLRGALAYNSDHEAAQAVVANHRDGLMCAELRESPHGLVLAVTLEGLGFDGEGLRAFASLNRRSLQTAFEALEESGDRRPFSWSIADWDGVDTEAFPLMAKIVEGEDGYEAVIEPGCALSLASRRWIHADEHLEDLMEWSPEGVRWVLSGLPVEELIEWSPEGARWVLSALPADELRRYLLHDDPTVRELAIQAIGGVRKGRSPDEQAVPAPATPRVPARR